MFAQVDEIKNVFLEAGTPETNGGFKELRAYPTISADGMSDLVDIGSGLLTKRRDCVD